MESNCEVTKLGGSFDSVCELYVMLKCDNNTSTVIEGMVRVSIIANDNICFSNTRLGASNASCLMHTSTTRLARLKFLHRHLVSSWWSC